MAYDYSTAPKPPKTSDYVTRALYDSAYEQYVANYNAWANNLPYTAPDGKVYPDYQTYLKAFYGAAVVQQVPLILEGAPALSDVVAQKPGVDPVSYKRYLPFVAFGLVLLLMLKKKK